MCYGMGSKFSLCCIGECDQGTIIHPYSFSIKVDLSSMFLLINLSRFDALKLIGYLPSGNTQQCGSFSHITVCGF